jgi:hypothetical protein
MSDATPRGASAWVLYWQNMPGTPLPIARDNEVVAVLPAAWHEDRVMDVLERLYRERAETPAELVSHRKRGSLPYPPKCGPSLHSVPVVDLAYYCGHNPILNARRVQGLVVVNEYELAWKEVGVRHTAFICEAAGARDCTLVGKEPAVIEKHGYGSRLVGTEQ